MVKWSILSKKDLELLTELGNKLQAGTKWEQTVGEFILSYTKNRIPIPSKDENSEQKSPENAENAENRSSLLFFFIFDFIFFLWKLTLLIIFLKKKQMIHSPNSWKCIQKRKNWRQGNSLFSTKVLRFLFLFYKVFD